MTARGGGAYPYRITEHGARRKGFSHGAREVCFPSRLHPPYMYFTAGTVRRSFTYGG